MNRGLLLCLLLLVAGLGAFFWLQASDPDAPSFDDPAGAPESGDPTGIQGVGGGERETPAAREAVDGSVAGGVGEPESYRRALSGLRGRLVWAGSRRPIPRVEIKLAEAWLDAVVPSLDDLVGAETMRSPVVFRGKTTTDEDGEFVLRGVHGRSMMVLAIGLKTEVAALKPVSRSPAPGELVDIGDVEILERGTVTGRVVDNAGQPVAGARVRIADIPKIAFQFGVEQFDPEGMGLIAQGPYRVVLQLPPWLKEYDEIMPFGDGRTGADGRFEIRGVRPGTPSLIVTKKDIAPSRQDVSVIGEQVQDVGNVSVDEGEFLSGQFIDGDGKPATRVRVTAGAVMPMLPGGLLQKPRTVGADGKFEISGLPRGPLYLCYQRAPRKPWEVSGPHRGDEDVKIVFGGLRSGTVTLKPMNGAALPPVKFDLFIADVSAYLPGFETHIAGKDHVVQHEEKPNVYRVRELPAGIYKVIAKADGFAFGTGVLDLTKKEPEKRVEVIELHPAPSLRFEARDEQGRPVEAARVYWNATPGRTIEKSKRRRLTRLPVLLGKTGADGDLVVDAVEVGATRFYCRHPGHALSVSNEQVRAGHAIRFVLGKTGSLVGEVAENGRKPEEGRTILAEPTGKLRREFAGVLTPRLTAMMPDGTFSFPSIQPGEWRIRAIKDLGKMRGPQDWRRMRETKGGGAPQARVAIAAGLESFVLLESLPEEAAAGAGSLLGSVRINGKPAEGAWVQTWAGRKRVEVAENGTFTLTGLPDGDHWIGVERSGHEGLMPNRLWEGRVEIRGGGQAVLHLALQAADVTVQVVDTGGRGVPNLPIELLGTAKKTGEHRGRTRITMATDSSGKAVFGSVPEGSYRLRSVMQRDPVFAIPEVPVEVYGGRPVSQRVVAVLPAVASGSVRWDDSGLADELERSFARKRRPSYLVFESEGRYTWGPVTTNGSESQFRTRKSAPGTYTLQPRGKLRWTSSPLVIPPGGVSNATVTLKPDAAQVRAAVEPLRPKPKKQQQEGAKK